MPKFELGATGSYTATDYNKGRDASVGGFAAFTTRYIGAEVDGHFVADSVNSVHETSVVAGPRLEYPTKYMTVYIKAQAGIGSFSLNGQSTNYLAEQYGGGIDFRIKQHLEIRAADLSYQIWPSFAPRGLTPLLVSAGIGFAF